MIIVLYSWRDPRVDGFYLVQIGEQNHRVAFFSTIAEERS